MKPVDVNTLKCGDIVVDATGTSLQRRRFIGIASCFSFVLERPHDGIIYKANPDCVRALPVKRKAYVNVYRLPTSGELYLDNIEHPTYEIARASALESLVACQHVCTAKIEWEE